jgi:hypothetical protein
MEGSLQIYIVFALVFVTGFCTGWSIRKVLKEEK